MSRIDANLATQLGDASRPSQSVRDTELQAQEVQRNETLKPTNTQTAVNANDVKAAALQMQQVIQAATGRDLNFSMNDRFNELVVRISDRKSGEVIQEMPSKEFMKLRERLHDLVGLFIDKKA